MDIKNVILLPTNGRAYIGKLNSLDGIYYNGQSPTIGELCTQNKVSCEYWSDNFTPHHLYITSDAKLQVNDWVLRPDNVIHKMTNLDYVDYLESMSNATKKIILTSDPDLINDDVKAITTTFIALFVTNSNLDKKDVIPDSEIKKECELMYLQIKQAENRLKDLRVICKHTDTKIGNYSYRVGVTEQVEICSTCGEVIYDKNQIL